MVMIFYKLFALFLSVMSGLVIALFILANDHVVHIYFSLFKQPHGSGFDYPLFTTSVWFYSLCILLLGIVLGVFGTWLSTTSFKQSIKALIYKS